MATQTFTETLVIEHCYKCHVAFGVPREFHRRCKNEGATFYCPNGHGQVYSESTISKQEAEIERLKGNLKWESEYAKRQRERAEYAERRVAAQKGQVTRLKNRAAAGMCPCCNRHFTNLERHMNTKHPDFTKVEGDEDFLHTPLSKE